MTKEVSSAPPRPESDRFEEFYLLWRRRWSRPQEMLLLEPPYEAQAEAMLGQFWGSARPKAEQLRALFQRGHLSSAHAYVAKLGEQRWILGGSLEAQQADVGSFQIHFERDSVPRLICPLHFMAPNAAPELRHQFIAALVSLAVEWKAAELWVLAAGESRIELPRFGFDFAAPATRALFKSILDGLAERFRLGTAPDFQSAAELAKIEVSQRLPSAYRAFVEDCLRRHGLDPTPEAVRQAAQRLGRLALLSGAPWWAKLSRSGFSRVESPPRPSRPLTEVAAPALRGPLIEGLPQRLEALTSSVLAPLTAAMAPWAEDRPAAAVTAGLGCASGALPAERLAEALEACTPFQRRLEKLESAFLTRRKSLPDAPVAQALKILARWGILRHHRSEFLRRVALLEIARPSA